MCIDDVSVECFRIPWRDSGSSLGFIVSSSRWFVVAAVTGVIYFRHLSGLPFVYLFTRKTEK